MVVVVQQRAKGRGLEFRRRKINMKRCRLRVPTRYVAVRSVVERLGCFVLFGLKPAHPSTLFDWVRMCRWGDKGDREMKRVALMTFLRGGPKLKLRH